MRDYSTMIRLGTYETGGVHGRAVHPKTVLFYLEVPGLVFISTVNIGRRGQDFRCRRQFHNLRLVIVGGKRGGILPPERATPTSSLRSLQQWEIDKMIRTSKKNESWRTRKFISCGARQIFTSGEDSEWRAGYTLRHYRNSLMALIKVRVRLFDQASGHLFGLADDIENINGTGRVA